MIKTLTLPSFFGQSTAIKVRKQSFVREKSPSWFWGSLVLCLLVLGLLMSYLLGVNSYASTGYEIKKLQNQVNALSEENQKMNLKVSEISSMTNLQEEILNSRFVTIGNPKFLQENHYSQR